MLFHLFFPGFSKTPNTAVSFMLMFDTLGKCALRILTFEGTMKTLLSTFLMSFNIMLQDLINNLKWSLPEALIIIKAVADILLLLSVYSSMRAILRLAGNACVFLCTCASHSLCDLLECERSHSKSHLDSAWSNSQHCPLSITRSAYRSTSAASQIIFQHIFFLFLCAILTLNCPTNTFPVYMISTQSCQIRWWENRSEIVLELLLLCNIGFRYVKPYWSIMFHIEMCLMYFYNIQIHICQLISIISEKKVSPEQAICFFRQTLQKILVKYGSSWRFFERRMLPRVEIEIAQLFPIQQLCFSKNRSRDLKIAHVGAYRSYVHMGLAACLETLWSKPPLLRMALLDFTPSP